MKMNYSHAVYPATDLLCEYKTNPLGVDDTEPRLSWRLQSERRGTYQSAYRIQVASSPELLLQDKADLWDTDRVLSEESHLLPYQGSALRSRQQCFWRVKVWDDQNLETPWSEIHNWEMGMLDARDWEAKWISLDLSDENEDSEYELFPAPYLRQEFALSGKIKTARLYITALGLYEAYINGKRVGDSVFTPGWTDYSKRIHYHTYDVTDLLQEGGNVFGSILSYGWYSGYVGYAVLVDHPQTKDFYGKGASLLCQLEITHMDGSTVKVVSDGSWKGASGPIRQTDILMGEFYDATREFKDWTKPGFNEASWIPVEEGGGSSGGLESYPGDPVRITQELPAISVSKAPGEKSWIFDFGQNFAGVVRLAIKGESGQKIIIRYGELLHPDGSLMTENLRKARATDTYVCSGNGEEEIWVPKFTYHGFQYAEVSGLNATPPKSTLTGIVLGADTERNGFISTNNLLVNQLHKNIVWTQRANFFEVPTDCPQRDERLGWLGDAQIFMNSASCNMNVAPFFKKWIRDIRDSQWPDGSYPNFAPRPFNRDTFTHSPAWMEAGVICPYYIWRNYGDTRILSSHYASLEKFTHFHLETVGEGMVYDESAFQSITPTGGWGDWLCLCDETPKYQLTNLYFGFTLKLMIEISGILGREEELRNYRELYERFKQAYCRKYIQNEAIIGENMTICAMIIVLDVLPEWVNTIAGKRLRELVSLSNGKMKTGIIGSRFLLPALSQIGMSEAAYKFLCNEGLPGWLYSVLNGATTIWERWDGYSREKGFNDNPMNSYNHYGFGAVCEWMFEYLAGIKPLEGGFKQVLLSPEIVVGTKIDSVSCQRGTPYGEVSSSWSLTGDTCEWFVKLPPGTRGKVRLPSACFNDIAVIDEYTGRCIAVTIEDGANSWRSFELPSGGFRISFSVLEGSTKSSSI